jgi:hypothetical protein
MWRLMGPLVDEAQRGECTPGGRLRWLCGLSWPERPNGDRAAAAHSRLPKAGRHKPTHVHSEPERR